MITTLDSNGHRRGCLPHQPGWGVVHSHDEGEDCFLDGPWSCYYTPGVRVYLRALSARASRTALLLLGVTAATVLTAGLLVLWNMLGTLEASGLGPVLRRVL